MSWGGGEIRRTPSEVQQLRELVAVQRALLTEWVKFGRSPGGTPLIEMHRKAADLTERSAPYTLTEIER